MSESFTEKVRGCVQAIPAGEVRTYGEVARACGSPRGARAVGSVMANNFDPEIPCHRVVRSDGFVGSYNRGGSEAKRKLLQGENVTLKGDKVVLSSGD